MPQIFGILSTLATDGGRRQDRRTSSGFSIRASVRVCTQN